MRGGLTSKEIRGVVTLLTIISIVVGAKLFYNYIERQKLATVLVGSLDSVDNQVDSVMLFDFDPNTIELSDLIRLGLTKSEAVSVIRYREYGKIFRIKEDLFTCYGISDSLYYALEPYIVIGEEYRLKRKDEYASEYKSYSSAAKSHKRNLLPLSEFLIDTVGTSYLYATGLLSQRQAEVFVKWRNLSGMCSIEEVRECYVVSDSVANIFERYAIFTAPEPSESDSPKRVDINRADSSELRGVYGIGEKSVVAILSYREKLGGFHSANQLSELKEVSESNFEKILQQILCDSCDISKIDINFASAKDIYGHPYITSKMLRRLLKVKELKGGWSSIEEMITDDILNEEEAIRLRPYLLFREFSTERSVQEFL